MIHVHMQKLGLFILVSGTKIHPLSSQWCFCWALGQIHLKHFVVLQMKWERRTNSGVYHLVKVRGLLQRKWFPLVQSKETGSSFRCVQSNVV